MVRDYVCFDGSDQAFNTFLSDFQAESDRAAAVLGPAFLDDLLKALITAVAVDAKYVEERLLESSRPLGSFSARIDAAFAFGMISARDHSDLDAIRKIRNQFAHLSTPLSFDDPPIRDRCNQFRCVEERFTALPSFAKEYSRASRKLFDLAVALLAHWLSRRARDTTRFAAAPKSPMLPPVDRSHSPTEGNT
jgi:DNA-binding MltR family transcriptional regulator